MPDLSMPEPLSQNGRYSSDRQLTKESAKLGSHEEISLLVPEIQAESASNEWSSSTKELIDTLPRVWTRGLLYMLVLFAAIVLPWGMFSKVDETGSARGRLEPEGKTFKLDSPVAGTVSTIKVKEGQTIKAGQTLLEIESEVARADLQQAEAKLEGQLNRIPQLELMKNQLEIAIQAQKLQSQAQVTAQLALVDQTGQRLTAGRSAYALALDRLTREQIEVKRYQKLLAQGVVPAIKLAEVKRFVDESQQQLNQAQADIHQAEYAIKEQRSNYQNVRKTGELTVLESKQRVEEIQSQLGDARSEIAQTKQQIQSLQFQLQQRILTAPTDGTIFQLGVDRAGSVLQPGQAIAQIAPQGSALVFRAQMPSQESGFLRLGMPVKLKFDAYPFQDYGIVSGRVRWISPDSQVEGTLQGKIETFELEVILEKGYIQSQNKRVALTAGQTATAEVVVRQRRLIDFVLDPFKKLQKGGVEL